MRTKTTLTDASRELFSRTSDESFASLEALKAHCYRQWWQSNECWYPPQELLPVVLEPGFGIYAGESQQLELNDWSFGQLCRLAGVSKEMVNRLSAETAEKVLHETMPKHGKPMQLLTQNPLSDEDLPTLRAVQLSSYTRLYNMELVDVVNDFASQFQPPPVARQGNTGLYCGEQDLFAFLIDADGWIDIEGEQFAPGFFVWNSEVGCRSLGMTTFWYQRVCGNHLVYDATDVTRVSRRHTAGVRDGLDEMRTMLEQLVARRDQRRDAFSQLIKTAMQTRLGDDKDAVVTTLSEQGLSRRQAEVALAHSPPWEELTLFSVVDALTRVNQQIPYAAQRVAADQQASQLLQLAV